MERELRSSSLFSGEDRDGLRWCSMRQTHHSNDATDHPVTPKLQAGVWAKRTGKLRAGLLINSNSRRNKEHLGEIVQLVDSCRQIHYRITDGPDDVSDALSYLAGQSIDLLAIAGGDGTISDFFTQLLNEGPFASLPPIVILPGGTANMTGGDIGLKADLLAAVRRLCDWLEQGSAQASMHSRPILCVRPGPDQSARYGMFFGAGAIVQGINFTNQNIHSRGMKSELSLGFGLIRTLWGISRQDPRFFQPTNMAIGIDHQPHDPQQSVTLILISTLERLFLNLRPYWGEENGKPLHVSVIGNPANRFLRTLPSVLRGRPNRHLTPDNGYVSYNADAITLKFDGPFTLDGEITHASASNGPVEISSGGELVFLKF